MKKILLCGANGFIGKNLLKRFSNREEYEVLATYNKTEPTTRVGHDRDSYGENVRWVRADLRDRWVVEDIMRQDIDIVLQYAATTTGAKDIVSKPYIHVTDNAVMNSLLLREAYESGVEHFIMPSCTIMYKPSEVPLTENDFNESEEIYPTYYGAGNTKVYLEKMCKFYAGLGRTKHTVLRQSNIYGPHDKYDLEKSHVFGATVTKVMTNDERVVVWGSGEEERDFLYVEDLVNLVEAAIEKQATEYELANASFGQSLSIKDLVRTVVDVSGKDLKIEYDETKPTIKTKLAIDNARANEIFGWSPENDLVGGLNKTIEWYKNNELR